MPFSRRVEIVSHPPDAAMHSPLRSPPTPARPFGVAAPPAWAEADGAPGAAEAARAARFEQLYRDHADRV